MPQKISPSMWLLFIMIVFFGREVGIWYGRNIDSAFYSSSSPPAALIHSPILGSESSSRTYTDMSLLYIPDLKPDKPMPDC